MRLRAGKSSWERYLDSKQSMLDPQDTFSRLPESVLSHLTSFLPSSDKDQLKFLSRKWRQVNAQHQKKLWLTGQRLNELEFPKTLEDVFHSLEFLSLNKCTGMRNLKLVNFKLTIIHLRYCSSLKNVQLNTPNLSTLYLHAPRIRPCGIEVINCKKLTHLHLVGVAMNTMLFTNCNKSFPVLQTLRLAGCDKTESINISSNSIKNLWFIRFNNPVDVNIDAPNLVSFSYIGTTVPNVQNVNFPGLATAHIDLFPSRYQKRGENWFVRLTELLRCLRHAERLDLYTTSEKNLIIPRQLRGTLLTPPLEEMFCIAVNTNSRSGRFIDLTDSMLWICPRVTDLLCSSDSWASSLRLSYGELALGLPAHLCGFCTSPSLRCWRHSVTGFVIDHSLEEAREEMTEYLLGTLQHVGRDDIHLAPLDIN